MTATIRNRFGKYNNDLIVPTRLVDRLTGHEIYEGRNGQWYITRNERPERLLMWNEQGYTRGWAIYEIERDGFYDVDAAIKWLELFRDHPLRRKING